MADCDWRSPFHSEQTNAINALDPESESQEDNRWNCWLQEQSVRCDARPRLCSVNPAPPAASNPPPLAVESCCFQSLERGKQKKSNGLDLLVKVWFVFIVLALEFPGLFRWFSLTFLVVPPYLFLCIYPLTRRHMMSDFLYSFISFRTHYSFHRDIFIPSVLVFFYSAANKHTAKMVNRWTTTSQNC